MPLEHNLHGQSGQPSCQDQPAVRSNSPAACIPARVGAHHPVRRLRLAFRGSRAQNRTALEHQIKLRRERVFEFANCSPLTCFYEETFRWGQLVRGAGDGRSGVNRIVRNPPPDVFDIATTARWLTSPSETRSQQVATGQRSYHEALDQVFLADDRLAHALLKGGGLLNCAQGQFHQMPHSTGGVRPPWIISRRPCIILKKTGPKIEPANAAAIEPPKTARPSDTRLAEPAPVAITNG